MKTSNDDAGFVILADEALNRMKEHAEKFQIMGVAVVAYSAGEAIESWTSKMLVVGRLTSAVSDKNPHGSNYLGIAYTKMAEMADTLKESGSNVRPSKTGEYGWQGGAVIRGKTGYLFAAFSGGPSEDDLKVSQSGLAILAAKL